MANRDIDISFGLEHELSKSIDKMRDNIMRSHEVKRQIIKLRKQRRQIEIVQSLDIQQDEDEDDEQDN